MNIIQTPFEPEVLPEDLTDALVARGVWSRGQSLQASGRIFMTTQKAQEIFDNTHLMLERLEAEIGRPLPLSQAALQAIRDDAWTGVS